MTNAPLIIGIDFGGTSIKPALIQEDKIVEKLPLIITGDYSSAEAIIDEIALICKQAKQDHPEIKAIGIGVPGFVNFHEGVVNDLPNVPGWKNIPIKQILESQTNLPVKIDNDVNAMAYAEWKYGAGKNCEHMIAMTLGTGLGGGIISNNQLIRGHQFAAGEIGHMTVNMDAAPGLYNNPGAVESYIGNQPIARYMQEQYEKEGLSLSLEDCSPYHLFLKAEAGDATALRIWDHIASLLASNIASLCWVLNPQRVVIGGGTANAGDILFTPLIEKVKSQLSPVHSAKLEIVPAHFKNDAGKIGAAAIALDSLK